MLESSGDFACSRFLAVACVGRRATAQDGLTTALVLAACALCGWSFDGVPLASERAWAVAVFFKYKKSINLSIRLFILKLYHRVIILSISIKHGFIKCKAIITTL